MKKLLPLLVLLLAAGLGWFVWQSRHPQTDDGLLRLYGNIDIREVKLAFNGSERIDAILVQEGAKVSKGQLLARLDRRLLEAQLREAEAALEAQRQAVKKLESGSRPEEIKQAEAELAAARARAKAARDSYRRLAKLAEKKLASPEAVEQARSQADAADAQVRAVQQTLALLKAGPRQEDIAAAKAQLAAREAALARVQRQLDNTELRAPADGIIRNRILEPGDMAFPQTPVLTLALVDPVWARAYLPEPALGKVKPGMAATIYSDSYPGKGYPGWVGYVASTAEFTPKSVQTEDLRTRLVYSMRVYACNPEQELRLGMPVTVTIDTTAPAGPVEDPATRGKPAS